MLDALDAHVIRGWCRSATDAMRRARGEVDALNVFPVSDNDTGTNLYLTMEAAAEAARVAETEDNTAGVDTVAATQQAQTRQQKDDLAGTLRAIAHGALIGARGNSGVLISQVWRGLGDVLPRTSPCRGLALGEGLRQATSLAYGAVARPVEGTLLTVLRAAGDAAGHDTDDLGAVARRASQGARDALGHTTSQLDTLARAGVVDAGGAGVCILLDALVAVVTQRRSAPVLAMPRGASTAATGQAATTQVAADQGTAETATLSPGAAETATVGPAYEVTYLLDASADAIPGLRTRLAELGDSLLIVGDDELWNVHVHVDEAGAAIEAGIETGRPHRVQVSYLRSRPPHSDELCGRGVVALVTGEGMAALFTEAGATVLRRTPERPPSADEQLQAIRRVGDEVVLLPNDGEAQALAETAAERAREAGRHVSVLPAKATVQGLAALAVHDPQRRFDEDTIAMTAAAGSTRFGEVTVATGPAVTSAGICQAGDVLGHIEGDVALIGANIGEVAAACIDRMLAGGGELVTLVTGAEAPAGLADNVVAHVHAVRPDVDSVVYAGGQPGCPLLVGVE